MDTNGVKGFYSSVYIIDRIVTTGLNCNLSRRLQILLARVSKLYTKNQIIIIIYANRQRALDTCVNENIGQTKPNR